MVTSYKSSSLMFILVTSDGLRALLCIGLYSIPTFCTIVLLVFRREWVLVGGLILSVLLHIHQAATRTGKSCSILRVIQYGCLRCISPLLVACLFGLLVFPTDEGNPFAFNCNVAVLPITCPVSSSNQRQYFQFAKCLLLSQILSSFSNLYVSRSNAKHTCVRWIASMAFAFQACFCVGLGSTAWITLLFHDLSCLSVVLCLTRKYSSDHSSYNLRSGCDHIADAKDTTMVDNMYIIADAVTIQLTSYEIGLVRDIWLVLLYILGINMTKLLSSDIPSTTTVSIYYLYSHSQCFGVVLVFVTAILLIISGTELIVHILRCLSASTTNITSPIIHVGIHNRPQSLLGLRLAVLFTVTGIVTVTGIQPQLQYIYEIPWFPLWVWGILYRPPGFIELNLCIYWIFWIFGSVFLGFYASQRWGWPRTCNRKIFHFVVVGMFIHCLHHPTAYNCDSQDTYAIDAEMIGSNCSMSSSYLDRRRSFLVLSLGAALCIFILIEYIRLFLLVHPRTHKVRSAVDSYMALFQSQEGTAPGLSGVEVSHISLLVGIEISHISLLVGIASTIWMSEILIAPNTSYSEYNSPTRIIQSSHNSEGCEVECDLLYYQLPYVGLLVLGVGDAVAACTGRFLFDGRTPKWFDFAPIYVHIPVVNGDALCSRSLSTESSERRPVKNQRTYAGSIAFFLSVIIGIWLLRHLSSHPSQADMNVLANSQPKVSSLLTTLTPSVPSIVSLLLVTITEALTCENDNFLLPLYASVLCILKHTTTSTRNSSTC